MIRQPMNRMMLHQRTTQNRCKLDDWSGGGIERSKEQSGVGSSLNVAEVPASASSRRPVAKDDDDVTDDKFGISVKEARRKIFSSFRLAY